MYIRDMKNTKGHIKGLTCGEWLHDKNSDNRVNNNMIATSSEDGTVRVWDPNRFSSQISVLKARRNINSNSNDAYDNVLSVDCCCWSGDGRRVVGGMRDGSVQIWDLGKLLAIIVKFIG